MFISGAPASALLEMTLTREEFARQLQTAFDGMQRCGPDGFCGQDDGCAWNVQLRPAAPARLGSLALERWTAEVVLHAAAESRQRWWRRFTLCLQRGGD